MKNKHILSIKQFDKRQITKLFALAEQMQPYASGAKQTDILNGTILINLILEPSTRTRVSFASAMLRLGGRVVDCNQAAELSFTKGESIADSARVLSHYGHIACVRHPSQHFVTEFAQHATIPVINAGNGQQEHPTQALLDLYTLFREHQTNDLNGMTIALVGDLKYGRTVHSLCYLLSLYSNVTLHLIAFSGLELPNEYKKMLINAGVTIKQFERLTDAIKNVDTIYTTRIQKERLSNEQVDSQALQINRQLFETYCQKHTILMHPLPRDLSSENPTDIHTDLDDHPNLAIFRQVFNGLLIRMALFVSILESKE